MKLTLFLNNFTLYFKFTMDGVLPVHIYTAILLKTQS